MRALPERQYSAARSVDLNEPIDAALHGWLRILKHGQPRPTLKKVGGPVWLTWRGRPPAPVQPGPICCRATTLLPRSKRVATSALQTHC